MTDLFFNYMIQYSEKCMQCSFFLLTTMTENEIFKHSFSNRPAYHVLYTLLK